MNTQRLRRWLSLLAVVGLIVAPRLVAAQLFDDNNRYTIRLHDGTQVVLVGVAPPLGSSTPTNQYYYLPTNLRLSRSARDSAPEFLFLKYTTDTGGVQGGLLHFLMEWGLTAAQQQEAQQRLNEVRPRGQVLGAAQVGLGGENGTFRIISATLSDPSRTRSVVMSKDAPILPGDRVAAAANLDAAGASLLEATFGSTRTITDVSVELKLSYRTLVPAAKGVITMDWTRLAHHFDSLSADYERTVSGNAHSESCFWFICVTSDQAQYSYSYTELRRQYDYMLNKHVIDLHWDETVSDDRIAKIREAFFQYFIASFAEKADEEVPKAPSDTASTPDIRQGDRYVYKRILTRDVIQTRVDTFRLNLRLAFNAPVAVTGNLASWYDAVKDNPRSVATVNLSNPFWDHFNVLFRVDFDAPKELFSSSINYVTFTLRKERPDGAAFERSVTMDESYVKDHGVVAAIQYARGSDAHPSDFDYRVQWSLRGGLKYPETPTWLHSSSLAAITLVPPVMTRRIEFEGDLTELQSAGITRVTAQVHYMRFGQEVEENIQLPVAGGEPLVSRTIFTDRDAKGYAYRLVFNHRREGRLALPWSPKVGDDYIYAQIPEGLLTMSEMITAARDSASAIASSAATRVLGKFADVLGGSH
ncbi:MAG TPA: hypothetical protein VEK77_14370 [Gemmatimonadales bacterium]|nr:hypothetical protein [Gemmatimonadales bacterium]